MRRRNSRSIGYECVFTRGSKGGGAGDWAFSKRIIVTYDHYRLTGSNWRGRRNMTSDGRILAWGTLTWR